MDSLRPSRIVAGDVAVDGLGDQARAVGVGVGMAQSDYLGAVGRALAADPEPECFAGTCAKAVSVADDVHGYSSNWSIQVAAGAGENRLPTRAEQPPRLRSLAGRLSSIVTPAEICETEVGILAVPRRGALAQEN